jgi:hypothetical protein
MPKATAFPINAPGSRPRRDPGPHGATAPNPTTAAGAPAHGAKAKPADAGAGD